MFLTSSEIHKEASIEIDVDQLQSLCGKCKQYTECRSPKMEYSGSGKKGILVVGDCPTDNDDINNSQFSGQSGQYLKEVLKKQDIVLNRDCWKTHSVRCHYTGKNLSTKAKLCAPYLHKLVYELKPKLVLILGEGGLSTFFDDFKNKDVARFRDILIPDKKFNTHFFCTFSPSAVHSDNFNINLRSTFERDIFNCFRELKRSNEIKEIDYDKKCERLLDLKSVLRVLNDVLVNANYLVFDYESTGLKPYVPGHKIASIGFATSVNKAYSFPFEYNDYWTQKELEQIKELWVKIMICARIKKIAHNLRFEDMWTTILLGVRPVSWHWDSLTTAHVVDNRRGFSGLKFQTFIKWGVRPYDEHIEKYLKSKKGGFNTVMKAPLKDLLVYNALDCLFTFMLYVDQVNFFKNKPGLTSANSFFLRSIHVLSTIQMNGIDMDEEYYEKKRKELIYRIKKLKRKLEKGREARKFFEHYGRKIDIGSNHDLGKLFYDVLGKPAQVTAKGNYKTDKDTLKNLNLPFVERLIEMKQLEKARGTYLAQFQREIFNGIMNPFFNLNIPISYRSSSSNPNFQNLPKRVKEIMKMIRSGIVPSLNFILGEIDFSGAEVCTSAAYHRDPTFINYLLDKSTDMHRDNALDLWMLDREELENPNFTREEAALAKLIRFYAKNNWTFAEFYGDWYDSCARNLWLNCIERENLKLPSGKLLVDHMMEQGIYSVDEFAEHCKGVEDKMWNERFPQYTQWKKDIVKFYQRYGYIETYFGFRFTGYMDRKQCTNYPIQGTSFHLLLVTLIEVDKFIRKNKLRTKLIGQIHDSLISKIYIPEAQFYLSGVRDIIASLKDRFKWLVVPIEMEAEISKPGNLKGNFSDMYEVKPDVIDDFDFSKIYKDSVEKKFTDKLNNMVN